MLTTAIKLLPFLGKCFLASLLLGDAQTSCARNKNSVNACAWSDVSAICLECLPTLNERDRALVESMCDSTLDHEAGPSIQQLVLFEMAYPETNSEALTQLTAHNTNEALQKATKDTSRPA